MGASRAKDPIVVTHRGGTKFAAQVGNHRIILDQPERAGGEDAGPQPLELLGASLGSCVALYVQQFCETRGLDTEGMRVEVQQHTMPNPARVSEFSVRVVLPAEVPERYAEMLERVAASCPAHNTLSLGAAVSVKFETPASVR